MYMVINLNNIIKNRAIIESLNITTYYYKIFSLILNQLISTDLIFERRIN